MYSRHFCRPWLRVPTSIVISDFARPQCSTNAFTILRHRISYNSQLLTQIQLCICLSRHNSGYGSKAQILFTKMYRDILICLAYVCNDIVQFTQHSNIIGSQLQQLIDQLHLINQTSGTTLSSSHKNLTSVSRHPIILCWLATSAAENWSANQQQNCTPSLSFSFFSSIHLDLSPFYFACSVLFEFPLISPWILLLVSFPSPSRSKLPFSIIASRTLVIIRSRHSGSIPIQCSRHANFSVQHLTQKPAKLPMQK